MKLTKAEDEDVKMIRKASASGRKVAGVALLAVAAATVVWAAPAQERQEKKPPTPGPMLEQGYIDLETPANGWYSPPLDPDVTAAWGLEGRVAWMEGELPSLVGAEQLHVFLSRHIGSPIAAAAASSPRL